MAANAGKFIGKCYVHGAEGVFDHLRHLGCTDVGHDDFALAEAAVYGFHPFAHRLVVGAYRAVVVKQLVHHVAGDDTLRGMYKADRLPGFRNHRPHGLVDGARGNGAFDDDHSALRAVLQHGLHCRYHITRVHLL